MKTGTTLLSPPLVKSNIRNVLLVCCLLLASYEMRGQGCTIDGLDFVCAGTAETYQTNHVGTPSTEYNWSISGGGVIIGADDGSTVTVSWNYPGDFMVECIITENSEMISCVFPVKVIEGPTGYLLSFMPFGWIDQGSPHIINYCVGDSIVVKASRRVEPDPGTSFEWYSTGAEVELSSLFDVANIELIEGGTSQLCVDVHRGNCSVTYCQYIRAHPIPDPIDFEIIATSGGTVCANQDIYFMNLSDNSVADNFWLWTVKNGTNTWSYYIRDLLFHFDDPGTYDVTLQYMPYSGCSSEPVTKSIVIEDLLPLPVGCPTTICFGETVTYELLTECDEVIWSVSPEGTIVSQNGNEIEIAWVNETGNAYGYITVVGTGCDPEYCESPTVLTVPLFPPNMIHIEGPTMLCDDHIYTVNGPPGADYEWTATVVNTISGSINLPSSQAELYTVAFVNFVGTIQLSVEVSHPSLECTASDVMMIEIYGASINSSLITCYGSPALVSITPPMPNMDIHWMVFYGNQLVYDITDDDSHLIPANELILPGVYTVQAELLNPPHLPCALERTFTVAAPITPIGAITGPTQICPEIATLYSVTNAEGIVNWSIQGGTFVNHIPNEPTQAMGPIQLVIWNTTGPRSISVYRKVGQCSSATVTLNVEEYELADIAIAQDGVICPDGITHFTAIFDGSEVFTWSLSPQNIGSIVVGDDPSEITVHWHYTDVEVNVTLFVSAEDCFNTMMDAQFPLTLTPFDLIISSETPPFCAGDEITFTTNATTAVSWEWTVDGSAVPNNDAASFTYIFDHPGEYMVEVLAIGPDDCGGEHSATFLVEVIGLEPPVLFLNQPLMCPDPKFPMEIMSEIDPGNYTYTWYKNGILILNEDGPTLIVDDFGVYTLEISDGVCTSESDITLMCMEDPCACQPMLTVEIDPVQIGDCGTYAVSGSITDFEDVESAFWTLPGNIQVPVTMSPAILPGQSVNAPGDYQVMLTGVYDCAPGTCPVVATAEFNIPFITHIAYEITCIGDGSSYHVVLTDNSAMHSTAQIVSREWTVNASPAGSSTSFSLDPDPLAGEFFSVILTLIDASGYTCTDAIEFTIPLQPELGFTTGLTGGCEDRVITFTPTFNGSAEELVDLLWDFGDGSISMLYSPLKVYAEDGTYQCTLTAKTVYGCELVEIQTITVVNDQLGGAIVEIDRDCDASVELGFDQSGGGTMLEFEWLPNGAETATIEVTMEGSFIVHVSDEFGCTFVSDPFFVDLNEPFDPAAIPMTVHLCEGATAYSLNGIVNAPFSAKWYIEPDPENYGMVPGDDIVISNDLPVDIYTITLIAFEELMPNDICADTSFEIHVHPTPSIDLSHLVIDCDPFLAEIYETTDQIVEWTSPPLPSGSSIMVTAAGTYRATLTNEHGCTGLDSDTVTDEIDVSSFDVGCRKECIEDIIAGTVMINGITGIFQSWEWRVNGQAVVSGSGAVVPLTLTQQYVGSITLYVVTAGGCAKETGVHFVETMVCSNCPPDLSVETVLYEMMPVLGDEDCEEYVYFIRGKYLLPPGFVFCDFYPVFEGGYVIYDEFTYTYQPPTINSVEFIAHMYITDFPAYVANNGLLGTIRLCDIDSEDICDADVQIRFMMPMMGMMCNFDHCMDCDPCVFSTTQAVPVISCMTLHFPDCGECGITQYTVTVLRDWNPIYSEQVPWDGQGIDQEYCLEYSYPYAPGVCFIIRLTSDCGHSCLTSVCLDNLMPCEQEPRHPVTSQWTHDTAEEDILFAYPNPNNGDVLFINTGKTGSDVMLLSITGIDGRVVFSDIPMSGSTGTIDTKTLLPGTYIISAQDAINGKRSFVRYVHMD